MKLRAWKTQLNMKFKGNTTKFPTDFEKILYACAYLRGRALDWAELYINSKSGYIFQNLAEFYQRLEDAFSDPNSSDIMIPSAPITYLKNSTF